MNIYIYLNRPAESIFGTQGMENGASDDVLDPVYTGTDPNGSIPVWVEIGFPFTLELLDPYRYGSAIRTSLGSLSKVCQIGSVPLEV